jgi:hypothetical protein
MWAMFADGCADAAAESKSRTAKAPQSNFLMIFT